jgi:hypothetical protein
MSPSASITSLKDADKMNSLEGMEQRSHSDVVSHETEDVLVMEGNELSPTFELPEWSARLFK